MHSVLGRIVFIAVLMGLAACTVQEVEVTRQVQLVEEVEVTRLVERPEAGPAWVDQSLTLQMLSHPALGDVNPIDGATATLQRNADGAALTLDTNELINNHVYTVWWIVVNNPDACGSRPCSADDVLNNADVVLTEAAYGGGLVAAADGIGQIDSYLAAGPVAGGWIGHGFDPLNSEIHIVLHDHGWLIPHRVEEMLHSYRGGCLDASLPAGMPATALSDGGPGPNNCYHTQMVIFNP